MESTSTVVFLIMKPECNTTGQQAELDKNKRRSTTALMET